MQTMNLLQFGSGGGLYGDDRDVIMRNWRFAEHSFEKLAADKKTVEERYPPGCHLGVDIYLTDRTDEEIAAGTPEFSTQWYPVGDLPAARMVELGFQPRPPRPGQRPQTGGYRPSLDGENGAPAGPYVVAEGKSDIWNGSPFAQFMDEMRTLGIGQFSDRLAAQGVAALDGLQAHLGQKALPKSKRTQQEEKLTGQSKDSRTILVPVRIIAWPWDVAGQVATPAGPKAVAAASTPASTPSTPQPAASTAAPAASPVAGVGNGAELDAKAVALVQQALKAKGGFVTKKELGVALMPFLVKEGAARMPLMQRTHQNEFLTQHSGSAWLFDATSETIGVIPTQ